MSREVKATVLNTTWTESRPDVVQVNLLVRSADLGSCSYPLPHKVTLVVPEPIPAPPVNDKVFTLEITKELLDKYQPEIRKILLDELSNSYGVEGHEG